MPLTVVLRRGVSRTIRSESNDDAPRMEIVDAKSVSGKQWVNKSDAFIHQPGPEVDENWCLKMEAQVRDRLCSRNELRPSFQQDCRSTLPAA